MLRFRFNPESDCVLCGVVQTRELLCHGCGEDLPFSSADRCPRCAANSPGNQPCGECLRSPPAFDATIAPFDYAFPLDRLLQQFKYAEKLLHLSWLAPAMAEGLRAQRVDWVTCTPLFASKLRSRGYNQAAELAQPLAQLLGLPVHVQALTKLRDTLNQAQLPWKERHKNIAGAFAVTPAFAARVQGSRIALVDDVMTTGSTLGEMAKTLKAAGAARVECWVVARTQADHVKTRRKS